MLALRTFLLLLFTMPALMSRSAFAAEADPARVDAFGDPLPAEARLRLGTTRYRAEIATGVALSPEGKTLAVCGRNAIILLDAATGKERKRYPTPDPTGNGSLVFSPDGGKIALVARQSIEMFDAVSGHHDGSLACSAKNGGVEIVAFSRDGKRVAVGSEFGLPGKRVATVWEVDGCKKIQSIEVAQDTQARAALSSDGKILATWGQHGGRGVVGVPDPARTIQLWDVATGKELKKIPTPMPAPSAVAFSPDGKQMAILDYGGTGLNLYDVDADKMQPRLLARRLSGAVLCYSPDGKRVVAGTADGAVQVWDSATGERLGMTMGPESSIRSIAFLPGDKMLAAGTNGQAIHLWEIPSGRRLTPTEGHKVAPTSLAFSFDGKSVLSCDQFGILFWDAATGKFQQRVTPRDNSEQLLRMGRAQFQLSPDGRHFLWSSGSTPGSIRWVEAATDQEVLTLGSFSDRRDLVLAFSGAGTAVAVVGQSSYTTIEATTVQVWDLAKGREKASLQVPGGLVKLALSADGRYLVTAGINGNGRQAEGSELILWDTASGRQIWVQPREKVSVTKLAFSPDGDYFALGGQDGVRLCDTATGANRRLLDHSKDYGASCLLFSPDGRTLALAGEKEEVVGKIGLWETATAKRRGEFVGHRGLVTTLAFTPDGRTLASGSADTSVLLWDMTGSLSETVRKSAKPDATAAEKLWNGLADADAEKGYRLIQTLAAHPAEAVALVKSKLPAAKAQKVDEAAIAKWVADLEDEDFDRRERASAALAKLGRSATPALTAALDTATGEKKRRLRELLDADKVSKPNPEMLRPTRALEVLERIGTAEAKQVLADLAKGDPEALLTRAAAASLKRLSAPY